MGVQSPCLSLFLRSQENQCIRVNQSHRWPCDICHFDCSSGPQPLILIGDAYSQEDAKVTAGSAAPHGNGRRESTRNHLQALPTVLGHTEMLLENGRYHKSVSLTCPTISPPRSFLYPLVKACWWSPPSGFLSKLEEEAMEYPGYQNNTSVNQKQQPLDSSLLSVVRMVLP